MQIDPITIASATIKQLRVDVPKYEYYMPHAGMIHIHHRGSILDNRKRLIYDPCDDKAGRLRAVICFEPTNTRIIAYADPLLCEYANPNWYDWLVKEIIAL